MEGVIYSTGCLGGVIYSTGCLGGVIYSAECSGGVMSTNERGEPNRRTPGTDSPNPCGSI